MCSKILINAFEANIYQIENKPLNIFLKFWIKGKSSQVRTKIISNTTNPTWNQTLEILSEENTSDILLVCMFNQEENLDYPMMDVCEFPLRLHQIGEHLVFNEEIRMKNHAVGKLHFALDFIISPEKLLMNKKE